MVWFLSITSLYKQKQQTMEKAYYEQSFNGIVFTFSGTPSAEEFRNIALSGLDLLKSKGVTKILNNTSELEIVTIENQEWSQTVWFPMAQKAGLQYFAFVIPNNIFGEASAQQTNEKAEDEGDIQIQYFKTFDEAAAWLKQCE